MNPGGSYTTASATTTTVGTTCEGLVKKAIHAMDKEFIPLSPGIQGRIGELTIDNTHVRDTSEIPIDSFVVNLTKGLDATHAPATRVPTTDARRPVTWLLISPNGQTESRPARTRCAEDFQPSKKT